jgi:hypothetical protein
MSLERPPQKQRRLRRPAACVYLSEEHGIDRKPSTLAKLGSLGRGPLMEYVGRIPEYTTGALDDYAASLLSGPVRRASERHLSREKAA